MADTETLKETRNDLLDRVTEQQRRFGMLPDVRVAEEFIDPILRKVEVDERDKRPQPKAAARELPDDPTLSRRGNKLPDGTYRAEEGYAGTYAFGRPGAGLKVIDPAPWVQEKQDTPNVAAARKCFRAMRQHPDWKARVEKIALAPLSYVEREKQLKSVLADYVRLYGDPRKPRDRKIQL